MGEYLFKDLLKEVAKDNISEEYAEEIIKGVSSIISGAVVLATHENVTDKELEIAQSMGESVVENNSLKLFKAGAKALKNLKDTLVKKGKLTKDDIEESLKGTSKDEALSILEDLMELTNDDFGFNDVFAAVSIATGLDLKSSKSKQEASEKAQQLYNKVFNKADDVIKNLSQTSKQIANGHAWDKHVIKRNEFPNIKTKEEFAELIESTIKNSTHSGNLERGRSFSYDEKTNIIVIKDPNHIDGGTIFKPTEGINYLKDIK
ncbi:hypothetical protein [Aliarcobacter butzleri]|uniref:hypothetical protein n=1 Tax=Aliarcobacter butzleri TaxID=28197 RepID=UPI0018A04362|nr:hypothetical protein [Aliarcobacter butzleri]MBF7070129.1 hypothetical protein [Aliarcobacter butzleri]